MNRVKLTTTIDKELLELAKATASMEGINLNELIESGMKKHIKSKRSPKLKMFKDKLEELEKVE